MTTVTGLNPVLSTNININTNQMKDNTYWNAACIISEKNQGICLLLAELDKAPISSESFHANEFRKLFEPTWIEKHKYNQTSAFWMSSPGQTSYQDQADRFMALLFMHEIINS